MNERRPKMSVDERLNALRAEGITIFTYRGTLDETRNSFAMRATNFYFNIIENQIIGRFSDGSAEFISEEKIADKTPSLAEVIAYANKLGLGKEDERWLKVEAHAIYEPILDITHFFVLPARSYIKEEPKENQAKELQ